MSKLAQRALIVTCCLLLRPAGAPAVAGEEPTSGVRITCLANEGFLLEAGDTRVLLDALVGDGLPDYPVVPVTLRQELESARGRFAGIDLILVSHAHADHFDPAAVARHLRANPEAAFLSTPEAVAKLRRELAEPAAAGAIVAADPAPGKSELHRLPGVDVRVLELHHGRLPIDNLGLIVELGGVAVLHAGDTSAAAADLAPYADLLAEVDVWLLPDWLLGEPDWEAARSRVAGGTRLVAMHLAAPTAPADWFGSAGSLEGRVARIHEALPDAWVPLEPMTSRHYPPPAPGAPTSATGGRPLHQRRPQ
jgi:L-ascorbate metabolism protein UlaG (beta-lactamase superfamily)